MLPTIIRTLEPLASSRALHLVVGLYISGALLLLSPDDRLLVPFFLLQRGMVIVLLWPNIGRSLVAASSAASIAAGLIYVVTVWCLYREAGAAAGRMTRGTLPLIYLPLRALAVALALLLTHGLLQRYAPPQLPALVSWSVAWLLVEFCFALLLAPTSLHTGLGILAFADAGRILYALIRPDPLVWGLWASCDVLVALAAAHLRTVEVAAYGAKELQRRGRRVRRETVKTAASQGETPEGSPAAPPAEEAGLGAGAHEEPSAPFAISAVSTDTGKKLHRRVRRGRRVTIKTPASREETPAASAEPAPVEEAHQDAAAQGEPCESTAVSADTGKKLQRRGRRKTAKAPAASLKVPPAEEAGQDAGTGGEASDPSAISAVETEAASQAEPGPEAGDTP